MASGCRDMTLAKAAITASNAMVFAFFTVSSLNPLITNEKRNMKYSYNLLPTNTQTATSHNNVSEHARTDALVEIDPPLPFK